MKHIFINFGVGWAGVEVRASSPGLDPAPAWFRGGTFAPGSAKGGKGEGIPGVGRGCLGSREGGIGREPSLGGGGIGSAMACLIITPIPDPSSHKQNDQICSS